ncbi:glycosyltransferase family 4 protein [Chryseobacterium sp. LAM-KRS1]|uniref:glycosyltransferase family 4 protein n=1 Tax=Chryseobacterium sp. LAM-KRS1 TaxID=2715754 RepID=UPI0015535C86|nr:glycosyltransferase family 4 protein [Chryseobacterium sp. LAM-KRS1]
MKTKVLIIYNKVWSYRERIFELINEEFDLTVAYSDEKFKNKKFSFKTMYLPVKKAGPFELHKDNLYNIASQYDVVIGLSNLRWISLMLLCLRRNRKYKIGYWGIGVTASYENSFDSKTTWDKFRYYISRKSDFTLFYSSYPLERYIKAGIPEEKLFVAHNTTEVENVIKSDVNNKKDFLFVGTLYPQKGIGELLEAYYLLYTKRNDCPKLLIVGDGPEKEKIIEFIKEKNIADKIVLFGSIYDAKELSKIFAESIACISPNQAGLSVLNSMGNSTSFVTREDAITGGEIFNIKNKYNGIIYKEQENLADVMEWIINNNEQVHKMNENAYNHYINNRTPEMMANEIKRAINKSLS